MAQRAKAQADDASTGRYLRSDPRELKKLRYPLTFYVGDDIRVGNTTDGVTKADIAKAVIRRSLEEMRSVTDLPTDSRDRRMHKLTSLFAWQNRRLVVTSERLYFLYLPEESSYEIVDSIPMHEIEYVGEVRQDEFRKEFVGEKSFLNRSVAGPAVTATVVKISEPGFGRPGSSAPVSSALHYASVAGDARLLPEKDCVAFQISTTKEGFNQGSVFFMCAEDGEQWVKTIKKFSEEAKAIFERNNKIAAAQNKVKRIYNSQIFQVCVILAITVNFIITLAEAQESADGSACDRVYNNITDYTPPSYSDFERIDTAFTVIFIAELVLNFLANAWMPFIMNRWNWFDSVVVITSLAFLFVSNTSNGVAKLLRIFRVFRVLRIFGRVGQLREIVNAVSAAIIPAVQALIIGLVVVAIYAAIGTQYFAAEHPQGFCDFFHAFYTMFAVIAFNQPDGMPRFEANGTMRPGHLAYIYTYICLVLLILLQIVIAVLLDSFYKARRGDEEELARAAADRARPGVALDYPLDPLLADLAVLFENGEDLDSLLDGLFYAFDTDKTGSLSCREFAGGVYKCRRVVVTHDRFQAIVAAADLPGAPVGEEMRRPDFRRVMTMQLRMYAQRELTDCLHSEHLGGHCIAEVRTMKMLLVELEGIQRRAAALRVAAAGQADRLQAQLAARRGLLDSIMGAIGHSDDDSGRDTCPEEETYHPSPVSPLADVFPPSPVSKNAGAYRDVALVETPEDDEVAAAEAAVGEVFASFPGVGFDGGGLASRGGKGHGGGQDVMSAPAETGRRLYDDFD